MTINIFDHFEEIWAVDFEFRSKDGNPPDAIVCMVAKEIKSKTTHKVWMDQLLSLGRPPFHTSDSSCIIAYGLTAELSCFLRLGWALPKHVIDLRIEFLNITNGASTPFGTGLLGALACFNLSGISGVEKDFLRNLILNRTSYTSDEQQRILAYCESDVAALDQLLPKITTHPFFSLPFALQRGRYMKAVARIEANGIPIDTQLLDLVRSKWEKTKLKLVLEIDRDFQVYDGDKFKQSKFENYLKQSGISCWPRTITGQLETEKESFKVMASLYPQVEPLRQLRRILSSVHLNKLHIGDDGRNRANLWPFSSKTGRNQPSSNEYILGLPKWVRSFVRPQQNFSLAYIDWCQQEFGIAAALSHDEKMKAVYCSTDPYLQFAKQNGYAPSLATKETHPKERELFKIVMLAVQYQMTYVGLARRLNITELEAKSLLGLHKHTFSQFWNWSDAVVDYAYYYEKLFTTFGWYLHVFKTAKERSVRNFPMQSNGAEMLRLACCLLTENGIKVCGTLHDAILIEAPTLLIDEHINISQQLMSDASAQILGGFCLKTEVERFDYPDRYSCVEGIPMWETVMNIVNEKKV